MADIIWENVVGAKEINDGGYIGDLMKLAGAHIDQSLETGRLTQEQAGEIYSSMLNAAFSTGIAFVNTSSNVAASNAKTKAELSKMLGYASDITPNGLIELGIDLGNGKIDVERETMEEKLSEDEEKWGLSKVILENQVKTSTLDLDYKPQNLEVALEQAKKVVEAAEIDMAFNDSKRVIMEDTRKDNIRMKATELYAEYLKYIASAGVVPNEYHFLNIVNLITAIETGISNPEFEATMLTLKDWKEEIDPKTGTVYPERQAKNDTVAGGV